ncbi:MAG TPA: hypothetical protein VM779_05205 [Thermoanaerobaculia bacterium]|nr:hypothetical protein [Thermoanaerobaculia bacterium]
MIYRNARHSDEGQWSLEHNPEAGVIARDFLSGELDLLKFVSPASAPARDLGAFLDSARDLPLSVYHSAAGELLITIDPWSETLLLTGRTADVLSAYINNRIVRMEDRFDMTVRQAVRAS